MRFRVSDGEVEHYARAKRDHTTVRLQGREWYVQGVTVDMMGGAATTPLAATVPHARPQWWVELIEA